MGAGKTTMGAVLARQLGAPFTDLDSVIEQKQGCSISQIFSEKGEAGFREIEEDVFESVLEEHISEHPETIDDFSKCTLVLSLGGGIVTTEGCRDLIKRFTYCIWVRSDLSKISGRLQGAEASKRPMLDVPGADSPDAESLLKHIMELYAAREPLYRSLAQKVLDD